MSINANQIKELRERTGAGFLDCKNVLAETGGDMEKAIALLREKGLAAAAKKAGRVASEGVVEAYIHGGGRIGVLVEVNCETDFVAKNEDFRAFVKDIAMQIAAHKPEYARREDVPESVIAKEREILTAQAENEGRPANVIERMVSGRIEKFLASQCLMEQEYFRNTDLTIEQLVKQKIATIGENISIRRFTRYEMGEGLEKKESDFVSEVMSQVKA